MRLLVVGASSSLTCGLRDHAAVMKPALCADGTSVDTLWWERDPAWTWRQTHRSALRFRSRLRARLSEAGNDAVLWHYAVFDYGPRTAWDLRGLPVYAPAFARTLAALRAARRRACPRVRLPVDAPRAGSANALAAGHRAALLVGGRGRRRDHRSPRHRVSAGWPPGAGCPARPRVRIPVCATLVRRRTGPSGNGAADRRARLRHRRRPSRVVVGAAARLLQARALDAELVLLGAPGTGGARARRWSAVAGALGLRFLRSRSPAWCPPTACPGAGRRRRGRLPARGRRRRGQGHARRRRWPSPSRSWPWTGPRAGSSAVREGAVLAAGTDSGRARRPARAAARRRASPGPPGRRGSRLLRPRDGPRRRARGASCWLRRPSCGREPVTRVLLCTSYFWPDLTGIALYAKGLPTI